MNDLVPTIVCLPLIVSALLAALLARVPRAATEIIAVATSLATLIMCAGLMREVNVHGTVVLWFGGWHPGNAVGLGVAFLVDRAGAGVATCVAALIAAAVLFSRQYFDDVGAIFYVLLLAMLGAMLAFAYTADAFDLFVFYEVFSVAAYALSAYRTEVKSAYQGALQFALVNSVAGLFILIGIIVLEAQTGELDFAAIGRSLSAQHTSGPLLALIFAFVAIGLFTRGALAPLHFWFDEVHSSAPTPLCVVLSGAMVPLALFGFLRLYAVALSSALPPDRGPTVVMAVLGTLSALVGSVMCLRQTALKRMLAFATVAHAGVAVVAVSTFTASGFAAAARYFGSYAFATAGLFMAIAIVRSVTGEPVDLFLSIGAGRRLYLTGTIFALGTLAVASIWPLARVVGGNASMPVDTLDLVLVLVVAGATGGACIRAFLTIFTREPRADYERGDVPWFMILPAALLVLVPTAIGALPGLDASLSTAASDMLAVARYRTEIFGGHAAAIASESQTNGAPLWIALAAAALVTYVSMGGWRPLRFARTMAARNVLIRALVRLHDGDVGLYVAWIVGAATVAAGIVNRLITPAVK